MSWQPALHAFLCYSRFYCHALTAPAPLLPLPFAP